MEQRSVALDGPAGAGKSTLARMAAEHFGLVYVDTGALYRCIGLFASRRGIASKDTEGINAFLPEIAIGIKYADNGDQRMLLCDEDVTDAIRFPEASRYASDVSAMPTVREYLLSMQRDMAERHDVIMDGRDIGTVVLPDAGLKVFLTADSEVRAKRRYIELSEKKVQTTFCEVHRAMNRRDKNDSEREWAPLKAADDAIILDTTRLTLKESFDALCKLITTMAQQAPGGFAYEAQK